GCLGKGRLPALGGWSPLARRAAAARPLSRRRARGRERRLAGRPSARGMILAAENYTWYAARAGGMLAFVLVTASVVAGLLLSGRAKLEGWPRFVLEDVHRFLGLLAGAFIVLHGAALLVDGFLPFSLTSLLVPGTAPYRPLAVALGVVAAELLAALAIANHFRRELSHR